MQTAVGTTELRQSEEFNTLLTDEQAVQPILALGLLAEAGLKINWHRDGCFIRHPVRGEVKVFVKANCPYLEYNTGMELMKEVEEAQWRKMARLRALRSGEIENLAVNYEVVKTLSPEAPEEQLQWLCVPSEIDMTQVPYNRSKRRRRIDAAKGSCTCFFRCG